LDAAIRIVQVAPESAEGWKNVGQIDMLRAALPERAPRYRLPYDPIVDLSVVRATYALRRGLEITPDDFTTLLILDQAYEMRFMYEAAIPLGERHDLISLLLGDSRFDGDVILRQGRRSFQSSFVLLHLLGGDSNAIGILAMEAFHDRVSALPSHS